MTRPSSVCSLQRQGQQLQISNLKEEGSIDMTIYDSLSKFAGPVRAPSDGQAAPGFWREMTENLEASKLTERAPLMEYGTML